MPNVLEGVPIHSVTCVERVDFDDPNPGLSFASVLSFPNNQASLDYLAAIR